MAENIARPTMATAKCSVRTATTATVLPALGRTAPASAETVLPIAWKAIAGAEAWRDGAPSSIWQGNMHPLITAQAEAEAAVANRPARYGHSTTEDEH